MKETVKDNKIMIGLDEVRKIQLQILKDVHDFCSSNNINYTLTYGTLIGTIRHKGYIPWDDDIDIAMPYPDYCRFLKMYNKDNSYFRVIDVETDRKFPYIFAKVEKRGTLIKEPGVDYRFGVNIDVFPIYGMPNNIRKQRKHFNRIKRFQKILSFKFIQINDGRVWYKNLILYVFKILIKPFNHYQLRRIIKKYSYNESKFVNISDIEMNSLSVFPKKHFEQRMMSRFENEDFYIPQEYDEILTSIYGGYMELPPIDKQKTHHVYKAYIYKNSIDQNPIDQDN